MAHLTHTSPKTTLHTKSNMSDIKSNSDFGELHSTIDPVTEKRLLRKLDWQLLPLFTIIYCINFIDRTAIGNAKIAGIEKDLHMSGFNYNIVLIVFYIFYAIAEVPSNLTLTHFGLVWLAALVTTFELVMIGTVFVARVFLGIAEGGTLSGLIYYVLSGFYHQSELILCVGIFFGLSPSLAGAFGGLLASSLLSIGDINSVTSWRKVFLIEGVF
uniref:Major facilitator superfamily (MFS) profile domain-containing protein n=1 Tax=Moniliophthora roreri TaxID=221103 RepID=A0A0W0EWA1_MONRR